MVPTHYYLILSAILFGLGVVAFVFKRNVITIFMSIELMLNAVNRMALENQAHRANHGQPRENKKNDQLGCHEFRDLKKRPTSGWQSSSEARSRSKPAATISTRWS